MSLIFVLKDTNVRSGALLKGGIFNSDLNPSAVFSTSSLFIINLAKTFSSSEEYFVLLGDLTFKVLKSNLIFVVGEPQGNDGDDIICSSTFVEVSIKKKIINNLT